MSESTPKYDLSVVIVNYNVVFFLEQCLNSVFAASKNLNVQIFVVDNNSVDGSINMLKENFSSVVLIENKENVGFSKANNQAIKRANSPYVLLLNPDTVIEEDTFDKLRKNKWWQAPLTSTLVGSSIDTALFFTIAFSVSLSSLEPSNDVAWANEILPLIGLGPLLPLWVSLGLADWLVKVSLALIALVPFRLLVVRLQKARL